MSGLRLLAAIALLSYGTNVLPAGEEHVSLVPWHVVEPHAAVDAPLALFWIPQSAEELRRSALLTSDDLTIFSSQCVAMRVVQLHDDARIAALAADEAPPMAVLTDRDGKVIGRVHSERGTLSVDAVEDLVRDELERRAEESEAMLDRARERAEAEDVEAAASLYQAVWAQKCVCPRQARAARKALRRLGR